MSISGVRRAQLDRAPSGDRARRRRRAGPIDARRAPAPRRRLAQRQQQRDQPAGQQHAPPSQLTRPGVRTGDSGTNRGGRGPRWPRRRPAGSRTASASRARSTIGPASTMPRPPPAAMTADSDADRRRHPLGRELVADDAEREREHGAAERPGRPGRRSAPADVRRERGEQAADGDRGRGRRAACAPCRPCRRPGRAAGWRRTADSSQAVSTQVTVVWEVCRSCWMVGSTGVTSDWSMENEPAAAASTSEGQPAER